MIRPANPLNNRHRRAVGVFPDRRSAEHALYELRDSGFPMDCISVVTRDAEHHDDIAGADVHDRVGNKADEGAKIGALSGGALGGLTGLLVGLGTLAIPGVGPIILAGTTATTLATALAGGAIGAVSGGLLGGLIGLGIPEERARVYHDRIARGGYLVIVDGTDEEIARAETILHRRGIEDYGVYDAPAATTHTTHTTGTVSPTAAATAVPVTHTTIQQPSTTHDVSRTVGQRYAVGFFRNLDDAEHAVIDLRSIGFPLNQISLVAHNFKRRDHFTGIDLRDRFDAARLGIPAEQVRFYRDRLDRGEYMVIVHGTEDELNRAAPILSRRGVQEWRVYHPTAVNHELPVETSRGSVATPTSPVSGVSSDHPHYNELPLEAPRRTVAPPTPPVIGVSSDHPHYNELPLEAPKRTVVPPASSVPGASGVHAHHNEPPVEASRRTAATPVPPVSGMSSVHPHSHYAVGFFPHQRDAEQAIADLRNAGFPLGQVSLVAQRVERYEPFTGVELRDRFDNSRFGFPEERVRFFNNRIARGDYLVVIQGTSEQLRQAEAILNRAHVNDFSIYDTPGIAHDHADYERVNRTSVPVAATPVATSTGANRVGLQHKRAIGVFFHRRDVEAALTELRNASFPMDRVSLIAKNAGNHDRIAGVEMHSRTGNKADEGAKTGVAAGGALGGLGGLLVGLGTLAIPGIGPVVLGGTVATALATTLAGGAIGAVAGGLTGALVGLGIPEDRAKIYNDRVARGDYLVMIDGTEAETRQVESIMRRHNIQEWGIYDAADVNSTHRSPESVERVAPDVDPTHRDRQPRIEHPHPQVTIIDRRDETLR